MSGVNSSKLLTLLAVLIPAVALGACTVTPPSRPLTDAAWKAREQALSKLDNWTLTGRIGVTTESEGWHGTLLWSQQERDYAIDIVGPLGQGRVVVQGNDDGVRVRTADGEYTATDPEQLLAETTGLRIPLRGLFYWVRGLPKPDVASVLSGDNQGHLARLEQEGWVIDYPSYVPVAMGTTVLDLPDRINARQNGLQVKLVIREWNLSPPT